MRKSRDCTIFFLFAEIGICKGLGIYPLQMSRVLCYLLIVENLKNTDVPKCHLEVGMNSIYTIITSWKHFQCPPPQYSSPWHPQEDIFPTLSSFLWDYLTRKFPQAPNTSLVFHPSNFAFRLSNQSPSISLPPTSCR